MNESIFIVGEVFGSIAFVIWVITTTVRRYKIARLQSEVQNRMLDRFSSSQDLAAFAQTDAGKQMLESLKVETVSAYTRIIASVQAGIVMLLVGGAMLMLRARVPDAADGFTVFGTLIIALGVGLGISSGVAYALSKSFHMLNGATR
jgi:hypothetical protein